jgi:hypothetical protein
MTALPPSVVGAPDRACIIEFEADPLWNGGLPVPLSAKQLHASCACSFDCGLERRVPM